MDSLTKTAVIVLIAAMVGAVTFVAVDYEGLTEWLACPHTCPSSFAPVSIHRTTPGTPGCPEPSGIDCYEAVIDSAIPGLTLSDLRFYVANPSNQTLVANVPQVPLGPAAAVSALGSNGQIVGVWSMNSSTWQSGSSWGVPTTSNLFVVLDTELQSNSTLSDAYFYVIANSLNGRNGGVGFPLFCNGC